MKNTVIKILLCVLVVMTVAAFFGGCSDGKYQNECIVSLGTVLNLVAYADDADFAKLVADVKEILAYCEGLNEEDGIVGKFNSAAFGEAVELDETVYGILKTVKEDSTLDGYNPLMAPLVDLWGFSVRFGNGGGQSMPYDREKNGDGGFPLPEKKYIDAFLSLADFGGLELYEEDGRYFCRKNIPSVTVDGREFTAQMDLGGCIKGYCSDRIKDLYDKAGIKYGYISFGTSSVTLLLNKSGDWTLALTSPDEPDKSYYKFGLTCGNASTSGDYENFYTVDGESYCHIIGKDGYPVKNARSVTVVGETALYCDMLSTALMTVPLDELDARIGDTRAEKVVYSFGCGDGFDYKVSKTIRD